VSHQDMPISPTTPDIHSIVEDMVVNLKGEVFLTMDLDSDDVIFVDVLGGLWQSAGMERQGAKIWRAASGSGFIFERF
jgi:hypothetical protein